MADNDVSHNWMRRIVPQGYATTVLVLSGTAPLLMNSGEADRESELYRTFAMLSKKKGKSLDDEARLRELEWQIRIYLDPEIGPYIPGKNIKEMIRSAATKWKKGEEIKRSLIVVENRIPLIYIGPRDQAGLWAGGFRYTTLVANAGAGSGRVLRCRPMFENWSMQCELAYDPEDLDEDFLHLVAERTQKYGLGDYRPTFGSFEARLKDSATMKDGANGDANKLRDATEDAAHDAFVSRVKVKKAA